MANIYDYLTWRGDIPFSVDGYNEVDGLIMAKFSYLILDGILPEGYDHPMRIGEVAEAFFNKYSKAYIAKQTDLFQTSAKLLSLLNGTNRYKDIEVMNYNAQYDPDNAKQFGAVTFRIGEKDYYVSYRGTDDTLAGWQEDFQVCYKMPVASQIEAEKYLKDTMEHLDGDFYILGHSKGGNLAMYAAMRLPEKLKERIAAIYNFDGPGFMEEVVAGEEYLSIKERLHSYMPQESVVGMILYHDGDYTITASNRRGIMQHFVENWEVLGRSLVTSRNFKKSSLIFNSACRKWISEISDEDREFFVELVFSTLEKGGDSFGGIKGEGMAAINTILKSYRGLDKTTKKMARHVLGEMIKLSSQSVAENLKDSVHIKVPGIIPGANKKTITTSDNADVKP